MPRTRRLDGAAHDLGSHLMSRNNSIDGYWGIGMLCGSQVAHGGMVDRTIRCRHGMVAESIRLHGLMLPEFEQVICSVMRHLAEAEIHLDLGFIRDGAYASGVPRYRCGLLIMALSARSFGYARMQTWCWAHDPRLELRRTVEPASRPSSS